MKLDGIFELELETIENAISLETIDTSINRTVKVFFPKLMPLSKKEIPKKQEIRLNKNLLANDTSTIPETSYKITTANYIELPLAKGSFENDVINEGDHLYVIIPNKNIKDMRIICM